MEQVLSGDAVFLDAADAMQDVWGKFCVVAYTAKANVRSMGLPSFGYTYRLQGYPITELVYMDRNTKSWVYPVTDEVSPVIAGADAGYLFTTAVA